MFTVPLKELISEFLLEVVSAADKVDDIVITTPELGRPGLQLTGFYEHVDEDRIQIIGNAETAYLERMEPAKRLKRLDGFLS